MKAIGGYFELADYEDGVFPHAGGVLLNTGRNALEFILRNLGDVQSVFLPYYDCDVVLEPLIKLNIQWRFYHINYHFEIVDEIHLKNGEYLIFNNYFGTSDTYIHRLEEQFGDKLIVDCAQAFFFQPASGIMSFFSPRKFVGVADGGVAYIWKKTDVPINETECTNCHDSHLQIRKEFGAEAGFSAFQNNEENLKNQPLRFMSETTKGILNHINYERILLRRRENYAYLHDHLKKRNLLNLPSENSFSCPMVYPYITEDSTLRQRLINNKVFVAKYWPNVKEWADEGMVENKFAEQIIPLPIDQRYSIWEMDKILRIIG